MWGRSGECVVREGDWGRPLVSSTAPNTGGYPGRGREGGRGERGREKVREGERGEGKGGRERGGEREGEKGEREGGEGGKRGEGGREGGESFTECTIKWSEFVDSNFVS